MMSLIRLRKYVPPELLFNLAEHLPARAPLLMVMLSLLASIGASLPAADKASEITGLRAEAKRRAEPVMVMDPIEWNREKLEGFRALFDGRTIHNWFPVNSTSTTWFAGRGVLRHTGGPNGWLRTESTYDNYVLRLQWRFLKPGGNAGLLVRASRDGAPWPATALRIGMGDDFEAGAIKVDGLPVQPTSGRSRPAPGWNDFEIVADGPSLVVRLNGQTVAKTSTAPLQVGFIGLTGEGDPFEVRNVRIRETGWRPLFNGKNLDGWRMDGSVGWRVTADGALVHNGRTGDLSTTTAFEDYDLRFDAMAGDRETDAGILIRGSGFDKAIVRIGGGEGFSGEITGTRSDPTHPEAERKGATPTKRVENPVGAWNRYDLRVRGRRVNLWLNGEHVVRDAELPGLPPQGPISLRNTDHPIRFRNIEIRRVTPGKMRTTFNDETSPSF